MDVHLKRIYDPPANSDGRRVLVDRLWPRGISRERARLDGWLKELAPSDELRRWFGHREDRWPEFRERYRRELEERSEAAEALETLRAQASAGRLTLLFGAADRDHNQAVVLHELLRED